MTSRRALQQALQPLYVASCKFYVHPLVALQQPAADAAQPASTRWAGLLATAAAGLGAAATASAANAQAPASPPHEDKGWAMLSLDQRRRQFFKYEKRIRELSAPDKVFEYFASRGDARHGGRAMAAGDVMRSVVPVFPPEGSEVVRAGALPGEPDPHVAQEASEFFKQFDLDNSGCITFDEWLLFQALLSVPLDDVEIAFTLLDADGDGTIDADEFGSLLRNLQARAARRSPSLRHLAHSEGAAEGGLVGSFFGAGGKGRLSLPKFRAFLTDLRAEMVRLEFDYYDFQGKGSISGRDFAHSVVGCARIKHVDEYLDKVAAMPAELAAQRVTRADFVAFRGLWRRLRQLAVALDLSRSSSGSLSPEDFQRVAARALGTALPRHIVDTLFYLFPAAEGGLNAGFMLAVMDRGYETGASAMYEEQGRERPRSFLDCVSKCSKQA